MKVYSALLALGVSIMCSAFAQAAEKSGDWSLNKISEAATGISGKSISTLSTNTLQGASKAGVVELGYSCNGDFYLLAKDVGFAIDDVKCGPYGCKKRQHGQVKFDKAVTTNAEFVIWQASNDGMYLLNDKTELIKEMKAGNSVMLALELSNTDGLEQMATFSLKGFTAAYNWCAK